MGRSGFTCTIGRNDPNESAMGMQDGRTEMKSGRAELTNCRSELTIGRTD
jgi:hypothetical protein